MLGQPCEYRLLQFSSDFEALRNGFGLIFTCEMGRRVMGGGCELLQNG